MFDVCDDEVKNVVETNQILLIDKVIESFIILRALNVMGQSKQKSIRYIIPILIII